MSAGLNSQVGLAFGRYAPCAQPNLRKPDEQRHGRVREPALKLCSFQLSKVCSFRLKLTPELTVTLYAASVLRLLLA